MNKNLLAAACIALLLQSVSSAAATRAQGHDPLASVDLHRAAIIADIVASFAADASDRHPRLAGELAALRADQLLAASLASSYATLRAILSEARSAAPRPVTKALGDPNADLTYTPLAPCRLVDTRGLGAPIQGGAFAPNERRSYDPAGQCAVPAAGVGALMISFTTQNLTPASGGYLAIVAPAAPIAATVDIFNLESEWSGSNTVVATGGGGEFDVFVHTANAHVVVDILGFFRAPSGIPAGDITAVTAGTGIVGGASSGDAAIAVAPSFQLPQACGATQVPKWNGAGWACAADNDTNTTYAAGAGLSLTGNEFSLPATQQLPTPACGNAQIPKWNGAAWACAADDSGPVNAFTQGGNAFGSTAVLGTTDSQPVEIRSGGLRVLTARSFPDNNAIVIGGSPSNDTHIGVVSATIAGGGTVLGGIDRPNIVTWQHGAIVGGYGNTAGHLGFVGGGSGNEASGSTSVVAGGFSNNASGAWSTVAGGYINSASGDYSTVSGGTGSSAMGESAVIGGGRFHMVQGDYATVPGGDQNTANGDYSFAAGRRAAAEAAGCFVWGDSTDADVACPAPNSFVARATGGARFYTNAALTTGVSIAAGGGSWASLSDRAAKKDLAPVDARSVLERVAAMPLYTWRYIGETSGALHLGPVAQDFRAAFGLGDGDRTITTIDADGVAFAAIQGLGLENRELKQRLAAQKARIDELEAALGAIRQRLGIPRAEKVRQPLHVGRLQ